MPPPSRDEIKVATDVLRTEAREWDQVSVTLAAIEAKVHAMELGRVEAGLFQLIVGPYNAVVGAVTDRCREGKQQTAEVASTLRQVADTYEREDANNAHKIHNLY